ncbi:putative reverse transcriptase zinc-binding domain-containing protein [Arabidopsis thaliana]
MWRKMLKYREQAKMFHKVEVKNGATTSFWYDSWSSMGVIYEKLGDRGCIDMGIPKNSMLSEAISKPRTRNHRQSFVNLIEVELQNLRTNRRETEHDIPLWRGKNDCYRKNFVSKETWLQIRSTRPEMQDYKAIWFSDATPKYAFVTWLVVKNRIATGREC